MSKHRRNSRGRETLFPALISASRRIPPMPSIPTAQQLQDELEAHVTELRAMYTAEGARPLTNQYFGPLKIGFWVEARDGRFWVAVAADTERINKPFNTWAAMACPLATPAASTSTPFAEYGPRHSTNRRSKTLWSTPDMLESLSPSDISQLARDIARELGDE